MQLELILQVMQEAFPATRIEARPVPLGETCIALPPEHILDVLRLLVERFDLRHLSAITGQDVGGKIELLYHLWGGRGLTLRTSLSRENTRIASVTGLIPGAAFYEREVCEMLGVTFDGLAVQCRLLLPDEWEGGHPLRGDEPESGRSG